MRYVIHKKRPTDVAGNATSNAHIELVRHNAIDEIQHLDPGKAWAVEIKEYRKKRSLDQNAYIHAVPLKILAEHTGYELEELKEYLCGEFSGWDQREVFGKTKVRPKLRTSDMDSQQMTQFIEFLIWFGSDKLGLTIPYPTEEM